MNSFNCHISHKLKDGSLNKNVSTACWAVLSRYYDREDKFGIKDIDKQEEDIIYISNFRRTQTEKDIPLLIQLINEISPCELVTINNIEYIKFQLLKTYDQSLILLNFIRNLWNHPGVSHTEGAQQPFLPKYIDIFFDELKKSKYQDPLQKLTDANKKACVDYRECSYGLGHSNVHTAKDLIIKDSKSLLQSKISSTRDFLITQ